MFLLFIISCSPIGSDKQIAIIEDAYMNLPLKGQLISAGYFKFFNNSEDDVKITGVDCVDLNITMHKSFIDEVGIMKMEKITLVQVKSKTQHFFEPGHDHLMVRGLTQNSSGVIKCNILLGDYSIATNFHIK
mgnify:FL=1